MKKILCLVLALAFAFCTVGCGVEIEDANGPDDFSLTEITDDNIINLDLGASSYSQSPSSEDTADLSKVTKFKSNSFSGVAEIYGKNLIGKSDLTIDVTSIQVDEGNFRLLVLLDDQIVHEFDLEEMNQTYELRDVSGNVSVRMAGESANFKFSIRVW